jgi:hypothetical protein
MLLGLIFIIALISIACLLVWAMIMHNQTIGDLFTQYRAEMDRLRVNTRKEHQDGTERHSIETTEQERKQSRH